MKRQPIAGAPASVEPSALLSADQAALRLGVRRRFVVDAARRGEIACVVLRRGRDGRATIISFRPEDIDAFITARVQEAR